MFALTVVVAVDELFPVTGSLGTTPAAGTVAVLLITVPLAVVATTVPVMVTIADVPASSTPIAQVMGAVPEHVPEPAGEALVHIPVAPVICPGIVSDKVRPDVAWFGPSLGTVMVYEMLFPAMTVAGAVLVTWMSACLTMPAGLMARFLSLALASRLL